MIVNKRELSEILGVAENTLTTWQKQPGFPMRSAGAGKTGNEYDTSEVIAWLRKREVDNLTANLTAIDIEEAKRRKIAAEAGLAELELAKEQGTVVLIEDVAEQFGEQLSALRAKLLSMPSKTASLVFTAKDLTEAKEILENTILESLNELVGFRQSEAEGGLARSFEQDLEREIKATSQTNG